jgi:molybdopterin/thiamine biosynthesis adenylyltransferase
MTSSSGDNLPARYARNRETLSVHDQKTLQSSHVCIVGLGGLGGAVIEILARLGIGTLTLIDGDVFEESNLNRQLLSTMQNLGTSKAEAAAGRIQQINPLVKTIVHSVFLNADNASALIAGADVAADCLDNLKTRFLLERAARAASIPMVSAAIAGTFGQMTTIFPDDAGLTLVYGPEHTAPDRGAEADLGTLPYTAMALAALECSEITKILLQRGRTLKNKLLVLDLMENVLEVLPLIPV